MLLATTPSIDHLGRALALAEREASRRARLRREAELRLETHGERHRCGGMDCRFPERIRQTIARHGGALEALEAGVRELGKWT